MWLQFAGVNWKQQTPLDSLVLFADGQNPATPRARLALRVLLDPQKRANACSEIILGALGGTLVSKEGLRVRMKALARGSDGQTYAAEYALLDGLHPCPGGIAAPFAGTAPSLPPSHNPPPPPAPRSCRLGTPAAPARPLVFNAFDTQCSQMMTLSHYSFHTSYSASRKLLLKMYWHTSKTL